MWSGQRKTCLSRQDRTNLGFGQQATTKQNRLISEIGRFWGLGKAPRRITCLSRQDRRLGRPPQSKIALSRRDTAGRTQSFCDVPNSQGREWLQDGQFEAFVVSQKSPNGVLQPSGQGAGWGGAGRAGRIRAGRAKPETSCKTVIRHSRS